MYLKKIRESRWVGKIDLLHAWIEFDNKLVNSSILYGCLIMVSKKCPIFNAFGRTLAVGFKRSTIAGATLHRLNCCTSYGALKKITSNVRSKWLKRGRRHCRRYFIYGLVCFLKSSILEFVILKNDEIISFSLYVQNSV